MRQRHTILNELIAAARSGDRKRFDQLFDVWFEAVYAVSVVRVDGDRKRAQPLTRRLLIGRVRTAIAEQAATAEQAPRTAIKSTKDPRRGASMR
jgi:hypothetical protein